MWNDVCGMISSDNDASSDPWSDEARKQPPTSVLKCNG